MRKLLLAIVLSVSMQPGASRAEFGDGNHMLKACVASIAAIESRDSNPVLAGQCLGFVHAAKSILAFWEYDETGYVCIPESVSNGQVIRVYVKWLNEHPERLHELDALLFITAMQESFPCE